MESEIENEYVNDETSNWNWGIFFKTKDSLKTKNW
jgi:hypothetical protein